MTVADLIRETPLEVWECPDCGSRVELFIRALGKPVCWRQHKSREMVRIWDREVGGEMPPRGEEDADV